MYPYEIIFGLGMYEIMITIGLVLVLCFADKMGIKRGFSLKLQRLFIINFLLTIIIGLLGAVFFQAVYNWIETGEFSFKSGMTFYGGFIFGLITFLVVWFVGGKKYGIGDEVKRKFFDIADIAAAVVPMGHAFGRIGCLFAGCCHGQESDAWYAIKMLIPKEIDGVTKMVWTNVVPVQLFEALFLLALSAVMFWLFFNRKTERKLPLVSIYAGGYGIWRFIIEFVRADERGQTIIPFLSPSQLVAVVLVLVSVGFVVFWKRYKDRSAWDATILPIKETEKAIKANEESEQSSSDLKTENK